MEYNLLVIVSLLILNLGNFSILYFIIVVFVSIILVIISNDKKNKIKIRLNLK